MPGLAFSNKLISRDKGLQCDFACRLYSKLQHKVVDELRIVKIVMHAMQIEKEFVTDTLPVKSIGMNSKLMQKYIGFCANRLLVALGASKYYNTQNPFEWMESIYFTSRQDQLL
jgi:ribonucleotide reductase beta subunit family protein with ferritin-like domain